jgi:N-acetylglucosamine-6-sulfatase
MVVFCSDNGFMWGEHRLYGKAVPYTESTRMPLVIRWPWMGQPNTRAIVEGVDFAPTVAELAEVDLTSDGQSLVPVFTRGEAGHPMGYIESTVHSGNPAFVQAQRRRRTYTRHVTGEEEWYENDVDPYQLNNRVDRASRQGTAALTEARAFVD